MSSKIQDNKSKPLKGIRIIDLTRRLSGPYCTLLLADLGAEVIKIEQPGGDPTRRKGPFVDGISVPFSSLNRGKNILELDLKNDIALETLKKLMQSADVMVDNFRPGVLDRLGLSQEVVKEVNPLLIQCSLTAFGLDNRLPADDAMIQALCGTMFATGAEGAPPVRVALPISAITNAIYAAIAISAALFKRSKSGSSTRLDVAMLDSLAAVMEYPLMYVGTMKKAPPRHMAQHPTATPSQVFKVKDGLLVIMAASNENFAKLARSLNREEWIEDPRFNSNDERINNRSQLVEEIESVLQTNDVLFWDKHLSDSGVACAPIFSIKEAIELPPAKDRHLVNEYKVNHTEMEGELSTTLKLLNLPFGPSLGGATRDKTDWNHNEFTSTDFHVKPMVSNTPITHKNQLLKGVKVVDLTRFLSGPFCASILSDLGATVIKVEPPVVGDPTREFRPKKDNVSGYFASINRGKSTITLNLKDHHDQKVLDTLLIGADVLVDNFRPGVLDRLGYNSDKLNRLNSKLVHTSISGFGQKGEYAKKAAFDMTVQAISGMMQVNGDQHSGPTRAGISLGDIAAGLYAAIATIAAINTDYTRVKKIDISMFDCQLALLHSFLEAELAGEPLPVKTGSMHPTLMPLGAFPTSDGFIHISAANDKDFKTLCDAVGISNDSLIKECLLEKQRIKKKGVLFEHLKATFSRYTTSSLVELLAPLNILCGPVNTVEEAFKSNLFDTRSIIQDTVGEHVFSLVSSPVKVYGEINSKLGKIPSLDECKEKVLSCIHEIDNPEKRVWDEIEAY